jgi:Ca2+-binding EF-hand superfamily protein
MKRLIKPLIASTLLIVASGVYAQSYSSDKVNTVINAMDSNNNDKVNFKEYLKQSFTQNNDSFDVNKDGYITAGEVILEIKEDLVQTINEMRKQGVSETDINKTIEAELNTAKAEAEAIIKSMDTDHDNLVEPEEIEAFQLKQFHALDKNHDGNISSADTKPIKKAPKKSPAKGYSVVPYEAS